LKKLLCCAVFAAMTFPSLASAQVKIDMTRVTCADYLGMPPHEASLTSAWMSGWFNQKRGYVWIDLGDYEANVAEVHQFCVGNPQAQLMGTIQHVVTKK
jgi:hypothetical protein